MIVYYPAVAVRQLGVHEEDICWGLPHHTIDDALSSAKVIACPGEDSYGVFAVENDTIKQVY